MSKNDNYQKPMSDKRRDFMEKNASPPTFRSAREKYFSENPDSFTNNDLKQFRVSAAKYKLMELYRLDNLPDGLAEAIVCERCRTNFAKRKAIFIFQRILTHAESEHVIIRFRSLSFLEAIHLQLDHDYLLMNETLSKISNTDNDSLGHRLLCISQDKKKTLSYTGYVNWNSNVRLLSDYYEVPMSELQASVPESIISSFPEKQQEKVRNTLMTAISQSKGDTDNEPKR